VNLLCAIYPYATVIVLASMMPGLWVHEKKDDSDQHWFNIARWFQRRDLRKMKVY